MSPPVPQADRRSAQPDAGADLPLRRRLMSKRATLMLVRNTVVSCAVFALSLGLLWLLVQAFGMNTYLALAISFVAANTTHYLLGRAWIFAGSERKLAKGYVYFFLNSGVGLAATAMLFAVFTEYAGMNYLLARVVVSLIVGLAMFVSSALLNFKAL